MDGGSQDLGAYKGKVVLVTNVASAFLCSLMPWRTLDILLLVIGKYIFCSMLLSSVTVMVSLTRMSHRGTQILCLLAVTFAAY